MRVGNTEILIRDLVNQIKVRKMSKRNRAPNCTHLDMDRVFGRHQLCDVCGNSSSIGFLYECRQDWETQSLREMLKGNDDEEVVKSDTRLSLELLEMSESVILAAEQGHYTKAQLEKLKIQKKELREIISDQLQASHINDAAARLTALAQIPSNNDGTLNSTFEKDAGPPMCTLKACHACRPYYRERLYISFQSVLDLDFPPMTREDADCLPTKSAQIMKTFGDTRRPFPSFSTIDTAPTSLPTSTSFGTSTDAPPTASTSTSTTSALTFKTTQTDLDAISAQRRPRRRFYKVGHRTSGDIARDLSRQPSRLSRQGLKSALQGIFRPNRDSSSSGSNITLPVSRTGTVRNSSEAQDIGDFDLPALRKVRKQKERIDFKNGTCATGYKNVLPQASASVSTPQILSKIGPSDAQRDNGPNETNSSYNSTMYSYLSEGSEVEVEGGLALTEEAVGTHTPDILTVDMMKNATIVQDMEMDVSEDEGSDLGLQSIMTQV